jgi:hypothetical protein
MHNLVQARAHWLQNRFPLFVRDFSYRFFYKTLCRRARPAKTKKMRAKLYKVRGRAVAKGKLELIDLDVEFDGKRAYVIWESITLGNYLLKARVEIDPQLLLADQGRGCDYVYRGELVLPNPENN